MERREKRKNIIMLAIVTIIVIYISVSIFGVVRDIDTGQTVFVISSSLLEVGDVKQGVSPLEKIKEFFGFPEKVPVPIERNVTIKGRVIYTNGDPFAHGLMEMRSDPRRTYTDGDGYFLFENVEYGEHLINVYSDSGEVLASCTVLIKHNSNNEDAILTQLADGSRVLEVSVDVKALQILLEIGLDEFGKPIGNLVMHLGDEPSEYYTPEEEIPEGVPEIPDELDIPINPPKPALGDLTVYSNNDAEGDFSKNPNSAANINIFGDSKRIAPGMSGEYVFTIDNTANPFPIYYDIYFIESNNELGIPMRYRLKNNKTNAYVTGDDKWHTIDKIVDVTANLNKPLDLNSSGKTNYTLEWLWEERGIEDNTYGTDHGGKVACTLTIRVSAQRK